MKKKNSIINKNDNNKVINVVICMGIIFLIGALVLMFIKSDKTNNLIKTISYDEYQDIIKKDEYSIILLTSPTCSHCNSYKPFVNSLASEYNLNVYNIDLTTISYDVYLELHDKYKAIKDQYKDNKPVIPTPATIIVKNGEEITSILGNIGYNGLANLLKNYKIIK